MATAATTADDDTKRLFAVELLKFRIAWEAAQVVFPGDVYAQIEAEQTWKHDPVVIEHVRKLQAETNVTVLPTRDDLAREFWKIGREASQNKVSERLAALRNFGEVMEYMGKSSGPSVSITNTNAAHILEVPQFGTPEEWQAKARLQQTKLIEEAHGVAKVAGNA